MLLLYEHGNAVRCVRSNAMLVCMREVRHSNPNESENKQYNNFLKYNWSWKQRANETKKRRLFRREKARAYIGSVAECSYDNTQKKTCSHIADYIITIYAMRLGLHYGSIYVVVCSVWICRATCMDVFLFLLRAFYYLVYAFTLYSFAYRQKFRFYSFGLNSIDTHQVTKTQKKLNPRNHCTKFMCTLWIYWNSWLFAQNC